MIRSLVLNVDPAEGMGDPAAAFGLVSMRPGC